MIQDLHQLICSLTNELNLIEYEEHNALVTAKRSLYQVREYCKQLSMWLFRSELSGTEEEVYFFKEIKAVVYGYLFYYTDLFNIETNKPAWDKKGHKKYLKEHLYIINEHANSHKGLYQYYRSGLTEWDSRYFTRIKRFEYKYDAQGNIVQCEDDYSSTHDLLYARVIANEMLEKYLHKELKKLEHTSDFFGLLAGSEAGPSGRRLSWTDSKAALIELIYAIQAAGSINNGKADIKEIASAVEAIFKIDLGDYYRTYIELRNRTNRIKYLEGLKAALLAKMDEDDDG